MGVNLAVGGQGGGGGGERSGRPGLQGASEGSLGPARGSSRAPERKELQEGSRKSAHRSRTM